MGKPEGQMPLGDPGIEGRLYKDGFSEGRMKGSGLVQVG